MCVTCRADAILRRMQSPARLLAGLAALMTLAPAMAAQTPESQFNSTSSGRQHILEGNWQSCQEPATGRYGERVYDHVVNGVGQFEVHLGPRREFAIFPGVQDRHREHDAPENLLEPFRVLLQGTRATQRWEVPSLGVALTVTLGGGSRTDCESWFILLERLEKSS